MLILYDINKLLRIKKTSARNIHCISVYHVPHNIIVNHYSHFLNHKMKNAKNGFSITYT